jgi:hypothetical protein
VSLIYYSASGIGQLDSELNTYKAQLQHQQDLATQATNALMAAWTDGAQGRDSFNQKNTTLVGSNGNGGMLLDLINDLQGGINGVNNALQNAQVADGKVAESF